MKTQAVLADAQSEELADTLIAISVIAKLLASRIRNGQDKSEKGEKDNGKNERTCCGAY